MKDFDSFGLDQNFQKIFGEMGFSKTTEIQKKVIPVALAGKDLIAKSATGSGKTLAFGFPIIEKLKVNGGLQALILTPTRDLAEQVSKSLKLFAKYKPLKIITVYGGVALSPQTSDLKRAEIVVGTPGRILDHLSRKTIDFSKIKILVLDEADRMLDMGFIRDVTNIIYHLPKKRQTLLFSATISNDVRGISEKYMINPLEISADSYVDASKLKQVFYDVPYGEKFSLLVHLLKNEDSKLIMVFCNTKRTANVIENRLKEQGFNAMALHGNLNQNQRKRVLEIFHQSEKFILVCTDVASRGLDIKNVSHIYNYDTPKISIDYIHRIGRTARAGKEGKAITLLSNLDYEYFSKIKDNSSLNIEQVKLPEFQKIYTGEIGKSRKYLDRFRDKDKREKGTYRRTNQKITNQRSPGRENKYRFRKDDRKIKSSDRENKYKTGRNNKGFSNKSRGFDNKRSGFDNKRSGFDNKRSGKRNFTSTRRNSQTQRDPRRKDRNKRRQR